MADDTATVDTSRRITVTVNGVAYEREVETRRLATIPGQPPNLQRLPPGCAFNDRCPRVFERCRAERPRFAPIDAERSKACHLDRL